MNKFPIANYLDFLLNSSNNSVNLNDLKSTVVSNSSNTNKLYINCIRLSIEINWIEEFTLTILLLLSWKVFTIIREYSKLNLIYGITLNPQRYFYPSMANKNG